MRDVLQDLLQMLEEAVSQAGEVTTMIDKISKSITKVCYFICCHIFWEAIGGITTSCSYFWFSSQRLLAELGLVFS